MHIVPKVSTKAVVGQLSTMADTSSCTIVASRMLSMYSGNTCNLTSGTTDLGLLQSRGLGVSWLHFALYTSSLHCSHLLQLARVSNILGFLFFDQLMTCGMRDDVTVNKRSQHAAKVKKLVEEIDMVSSMRCIES